MSDEQRAEAFYALLENGKLDWEKRVDCKSCPRGEYDDNGIVRCGGMHEPCIQEGGQA